MTRLAPDDARRLLQTLDQVRKTAGRIGPIGERWNVSAAVEELRHLVSHGSGERAEEHLWTVGSMALRDVRMLVYMKRWNIGAGLRTFPNDFERLLEPRRSEHLGDPYPCVQATAIEWDAPPAAPMPPSEVWITHREMRLASGSMADRARSAMYERYGMRPLRCRMVHAAAMGDHEEER